MNDRGTVSRQESAMLADALIKASVGHELEAEKVLLVRGEKNLSPDGLDLLARLALSRGDVDHARELWQNALKKDPGHKLALAALETLAAPWILRSMAMRLLKLTGVAIAFLLCFHGLSVLLGGDNLSAAPHGISTSASQNYTVNGGDPLTRLEIPGCTIKPSDEGVLVVFDKGIFKSRCIFKETAYDDIKAVSDALIGLEECPWIIVEGHVAPGFTPPPEDYASSYEFGQERAELVANLMVSKCNVPRNRVLVTSVGGDHAMFPSGDARNRSVVIKLLYDVPLGAAAE